MARMDNRDDRIEGFLDRVFYHGTARGNHDFRPGCVAYLTPHEGVARRYASEDAEIDGGEPIVLTTRLRVSNPITIGLLDMQDLHFRHDLVAEYRALGHDCALGHGSHEEIAVFDGASGIEVVKVERLPGRSPSPSP